MDSIGFIGRNALTFDLSVILNVHDEATYIARTLRSTEEAARYARSQGARIELVIVLDRPTVELAEQIERYTPSDFDGLQTLTVDNGSLGPSRTAGIAVARGDFVTLCDADDLVSFNAFAASLEAARREGPGTIVVLEFIFAFGSEVWVGQYSNSDVVTPLRFITYDPFPARLFIPKALLMEIPYADIPLGGALAFEDWHLNCELSAAGARFVVAPDTILFYRRRTTSLSAGFDRTSLRVIPPTKFLQPATFLDIAKSAYRAYEDPKSYEIDAAIVDARMDFLKSSLCRELVHPANRIDPAIDIRRYDATRSYGTRRFPVAPGLAYYRLCQALGPNSTFTDVVLVSAQLDDYAAWYIGEVISALQTIDPAARALVFAERSADLEPLRRSVPPGTVQVALADLHPDVAEADRDVLAVKALQAVAPAGRIHFCRSAFASRFWRRFAPVLPQMRSVLYRLGYGAADVEGRKFSFDDDLDLISDCLPTLHMLIADRTAILERDLLLIGAMAEKWTLLPAPVACIAPPRPCHRSRHKVIWLGPDQDGDNSDDAATLTRALSARGVQLQVERWPTKKPGDGATAACSIPTESLRDTADFDNVLCVLATAFQPGMQKRLLDAMAAGVPVIAARSSGMEDLVDHGRTGTILSELWAGDDMLSACTAAIVEIATDAGRYNDLSENAQAVVLAHHAPDVFQATVRKIFGDRD